jgi:tRNA1Val (adenine37-N6)-methyltransferase
MGMRREIKLSATYMNTWFQFKQFIIHQDQCAMKVCTDSCLFGAYVEPGNAAKILDIGTGTGLLALMLAQKSSAFIDAVEIEPKAAIQAQNNFTASPWKDRLKIHESSIQDFNSSASYDLIICNPPFYSQSLKSDQQEINLAYHSEALNQNALIFSVKKLLKETGKFYLLLPSYEARLFTEKAKEEKMYPLEIVTIRDRKNSRELRNIICFTFSEEKVKEKEIILKKDDNNYTNEFIALLKEYYFSL